MSAWLEILLCILIVVVIIVLITLSRHIIDKLKSETIYMNVHSVVKMRDYTLHRLSVYLNILVIATTSNPEFSKKDISRAVNLIYEVLMTSMTDETRAVMFQYEPNFEHITRQWVRNLLEEASRDQ